MGKDLVFSSAQSSLQPLSVVGGKVMFGLITWRSGFLGVVFSGGDLEFMVTSARDLHRDKGGRMKTQRTRNLVTWGFPNRGFLLNFSVRASLSYWEESWYIFSLKNAL